MESGKIVITGPPGSGKTSLVKSLEEQGYQCQHEISRQVIQESSESGTHAYPWENLDRYSEIVIHKRIDQYRESNTGLWIFDRSIIDVIAYMHKDQLTIPDQYHQYAKEYRYHSMVFITPPWEAIFHNDPERKEDFENAEVLYEFLRETYLSYQYQLIEIPKLSVKKRQDFVVNSIRERFA